MPWSKNVDWSVYYQIPENLCGLYLKRLGLEKRKPSKEYLDELIAVNQMEIPFENLNTTLLNRPVSLEPEKLVQKILLEKRGGFCFELNGIFHLLLRALGFNAWMCPCRQLRHSETYPVPATHCGILIHLDGREWFCDVGYGGPAPRGSLELKAGCEQTVGTDRFCFQKSGIVPDAPYPDCESSGWYTLIRRSSKAGKADLPLMQAAPIHCYLSDFYGQNMLRTMGDSAYSTLHVSRKTPDGFIDLTEARLRVKRGDTRIEQTIDTAALTEVLSKHFGIEI